MSVYAGGELGGKALKSERHEGTKARRDEAAHGRRSLPQRTTEGAEGRDGEPTKWPGAGWAIRRGGGSGATCIGETAVTRAPADETAAATNVAHGGTTLRGGTAQEQWHTGDGRSRGWNYRRPVRGSEKRKQKGIGGAVRGLRPGVAGLHPRLRTCALPGQIRAHAKTPSSDTERARVDSSFFPAWRVGAGTTASNPARIRQSPAPSVTATCGAGILVPERMEACTTRCAQESHLRPTQT